MDEPILHIVLYEPEIPHNAGAVGRTCVALGAKLWMVRPLGFRVDDRRLRRAGLDYWEHLVWEAVDDWDVLLRRLPGGAAWFFSKTAGAVYTDVRFQPGDVLVFGSESRGLPGRLLSADPRSSRGTQPESVGQRWDHRLRSVEAVAIICGSYSSGDPRQSPEP